MKLVALKRWAVDDKRWKRCLQAVDQAAWKSRAFGVNRSKRFECKWNEGGCASQWLILRLFPAHCDLCSTTSEWGSGGQLSFSHGVGDGNITRHAFACAMGFSVNHIIIDSKNFENNNGTDNSQISRATKFAWR